MKEINTAEPVIKIIPIPFLFHFYRFLYGGLIYRACSILETTSNLYITTYTFRLLITWCLKISESFKIFFIL